MCVCVSSVLLYFSWGNKLPQFSGFLPPLTAYRLSKFIRRVCFVLEMCIFGLIFLHCMFTSQKVYLPCPTAGNGKINLKGNSLLFPAIPEDSSESSLCNHLGRQQQHSTVRICWACSHPLFIYLQNWIKIPRGLCSNLYHCIAQGKALRWIFAFCVASSDIFRSFLPCMLFPHLC